MLKHPLPGHSFASQSCESLSTELQCLSTPLNLPHSALEAISQKASELLRTEGAIVHAPGHPSDSCMVLSRSGKRPHLVTPRRNGAFSCDDQCPQYQSSKLCSHVVAVAEHVHRLPGLVMALQKENNKGPNVSKLALTTMPRGRGRKGSKAPARMRAAVEIEQRFELSSVQSLQQTNVGQVTQTSGSSLFPTCSNQVGGNLYNGPPTAHSGSSTAYPGPTAYSGSSTAYPGPTAYSSLSPSYPPPAYRCPPTSYLGPSAPYPGPSTSNSTSPAQSWFCAPPDDPTARGENPFRLTFVFGNISVCFGCHSKYNKDLGPPHDLCIQHGENRRYT